MTWLPGNRNDVPPSVSFKAKCTSVSTVAAFVIFEQTAGGGVGVNAKKKKKQNEERATEN